MDRAVREDGIYQKGENFVALKITEYMNEKFTPKKIEEINMDRAAAMAKTLMAIGGIPVLICGIIPGPEGNNLVSFTFSGADKVQMREMLLDYLRHMDDSSFYLQDTVPE